MRTFIACCLALPLLAIAAAHADTAVVINNFAFTPTIVTVAAGTPVVWTNHDDMPHTVAAAEDPHGTRSPPLDTDDSYRRVFSRPGVYYYYCAIHPRMQGTVLVH